MTDLPRRCVLTFICAVVLLTPTSAGEPLALRGHSDAVYDVAFSRDGKLLVSSSYDKTVKLWDLDTARVVATLSQHQDQVFRVALSHDETTLASASGDGTTILWNLTTRKAVKKLKGQDVAVIDAAFSPDDRYVATAGTNVRVWNVKSGTQIWSCSHPQTFFSVAICPDQETLVCGTNNLIRLCQFSDGEVVGEFPVEGGMIYQLEFSPDGRWLASAHADGKLVLWDMGKRQQAHSIKADASALFTATFDAEGRRIVTGGRERMVRLWTVPALELASEFPGPEETILCASYSPNGRHLACGCYIGKIRVWQKSNQ